MRKSLLYLVLSCFCISTAYTQSEGTGAPLQIGLGMVGHSYIGDLTEKEVGLMRFYPGGNISLQFNGKKPLKFQLNAGYGQFTEQSDAGKQIEIDGVIPNNYVQTSFFYTELRLKFFFRNRKRIRPYLSAGAGMFSFQPEDELGNFLGENIFTRLPEEIYGSTVASFPLTAGVQGRLNKMLSLGLDYTWRLTTTDYLDNIGLLGSKKGNDAMHAIQASLYFTLEQRSIGKNPEKKPKEIQPETPQLDISPHTVSVDWILETVPDQATQIQLLERFIEPVDYERFE